MVLRRAGTDMSGLPRKEATRLRGSQSRTGIGALLSIRVEESGVGFSPSETAGGLFGLGGLGEVLMYSKIAGWCESDDDWSKWELLRCRPMNFALVLFGV